MKTILPKFVEYVPSELENGILYISMEYRTAVHLCVCGCGSKVVTPITPTDWQLTFDGKSVSLSPSIGNWNFECKSHYFIKNDQIIFARNWSNSEIADGRKKDTKKKKRYFKKKKNT
ncbi:hypothetical protein BH11BAC5_BH11BAC5_52870 [soil metagenome]